MTRAWRSMRSSASPRSAKARSSRYSATAQKDKAGRRQGDEGEDEVGIHAAVSFGCGLGSCEQLREAMREIGVIGALWRVPPGLPGRSGPSPARLGVAVLGFEHHDRAVEDSRRCA